MLSSDVQGEIDFSFAVSKILPSESIGTSEVVTPGLTLGGEV